MPVQINNPGTEGTASATIPDPSSTVTHPSPGQTTTQQPGPAGLNVYELALQDGFVGTLDEFIEFMRGPEGDDAYEIAVAEGFGGTRADWLQSLRGEPGAPGQLPEIPDLTLIFENGLI